jgi:hypothetical protein
MARKLEEAGHDVTEILEDLNIAQAETLVEVTRLRDAARLEDHKVYQEAKVTKKARFAPNGKHPGEGGWCQTALEQTSISERTS